MKTKEAFKIIGGSEALKIIGGSRQDAWLVDRFTCQRMQDWRQAPEGSRLCLFMTVMLEKAVTFSRLFRMHNIEDWKLSRSWTG